MIFTQTLSNINFVQLLIYNMEFILLKMLFKAMVLVVGSMEIFLKQIFLKSDVKYCKNHKVPILYE